MEHSVGPHFVEPDVRKGFMVVRVKDLGFKDYGFRV